MEVRAMRTSDVLRRRGIEMSEEKFATLLDEALSASPSAPAPAGDPREVLTGAESVVLTIGGADLAAVGEDEGWPGTDAAASFGALLAGSLTVAAVAARLGLDASRIRHRLIEGTLYGVRLRSGWRLPAFQFDRRGALVAGVEGVLAAVPRDLHPVAVQRWFTTPNVDLVVDDVAVSPMGWLAGGGDPAPAAALAADL
jgi:hypothetical protein